ncbi:carbohydrate porin [Muricauda sp. CAU 1633]|uniref:carbohydrate porin n=1 Tax=Allomuricauda sp. CAU 1633 TaxID=2816036 RepID=UPI001A8C478D|nr:carbohydrate porin [Muricauda sp. CAU 1633]MBO0322274.1 carbohydrate porin [Muricauda sp. CAU 1633]
MKYNVQLMVLLCFALSILSAQDITQRNYLLGNWNGLRDSLEAKGLYIQPRVTVFNQNFVSGEGSNKSVFNGKTQLDVKFNGKTLGLNRWTLVTKAEYNFGNALDGSGQVLIPKNTAITFPGFESGERFDISNVYLVYGWKPGNQVVFGKINMVDMAAGTKFSGGAGLDAFWNLGFAAPVSGITPPYLFGAIASVGNEKLRWTFMAYDPVSVVGKTGFESPFDEGIVLSASPSLNVKIGKLMGSHSLRFVYSTQDGTNLYALGDISSPVTIPISDKKHRFYGSYAISQPIMKLNEDPSRSWGFFGQIAFSDGNPNPVDFSFFAGVGGNSFIRNRSQDKWGIALYNYSLSTIVDDIADSMGMPLRNEMGLEVFYQYWATNWFSLGADLQITDPIIKNNATATFLGLRSSIKL